MDRNRFADVANAGKEGQLNEEKRKSLAVEFDAFSHGWVISRLSVKGVAIVHQHGAAPGNVKKRPWHFGSIFTISYLIPELETLPLTCALLCFYVHAA